MLTFRYRKLDICAGTEVRITFTINRYGKLVVGTGEEVIVLIITILTCFGTARKQTVLIATLQRRRSWAACG